MEGCFIQVSSLNTVEVLQIQTSGDTRVCFTENNFFEMVDRWSEFGNHQSCLDHFCGSD